MTLKKFLKYFDDMNELMIYDFNDVSTYDCTGHCMPIFQGHTFDKGARKKLKKIYKQKYVLELNDDGMAVMLFPYVNEHNAKLCKVQINVRRKNYDYSRVH